MISQGVTPVANGVTKNPFPFFVKSFTVQDNLSVTSGGEESGSVSIATAQAIPLAIVGFGVGNATSSGSGASRISTKTVSLNQSAETLSMTIRNNGSSDSKVRMYGSVLFYSLQ